MECGTKRGIMLCHAMPCSTIPPVGVLANGTQVDLIGTIMGRE